MATRKIRVALAGEGAIGTQHLKSLLTLPNAEVPLIIGGVEDTTRQMAETYGIGRWTTDFAAGIHDPDIEAVILATPTPIHARQALACLDAGKHVLVEIPMADTLADAEALVARAGSGKLIAMAGHLRRFNLSHAWIHQRIRQGQLRLRQFVVQTHFMRRTNINLLGQPRSWTDSLLWHHACHSVDLFLHQTGEDAVVASAVEGPHSPTLGIPLDLAIQLRTPSGVLASISLSFNNEGPQGSVFRYICDEGTFVARDDMLSHGNGEKVAIDLGEAETTGMQRIDQAFLTAIATGAEPNASLERCLPTMAVLDRLERSIKTA